MKTQISSLETSHFPVMLSEIIQFSTPNKGGVYVDCTFGGGGYSKALLKFKRVKVIGVDRDKAVESIAKKFQNKFNLTDYQMLCIAFAKGFIIGAILL